MSGKLERGAQPAEQSGTAAGNVGRRGNMVSRMSDRIGRLGRPLKIALVLIPVVVLVVALVWWQDRSLVRAEALLRAGDAAGASETLDPFLARRPDHHRALVLKARALVALQRWGEAAEIFSRTGAGSSVELRGWATALLHLQQWPDALPLLEQLNSNRHWTANGDERAETLRDLTVCRFQMGQADAALESAAELAALPGHALEGLFQLGVIHGARGNTHLAIDAWERIEAISPRGTGLAIAPAEFFRVCAEDLMLEARPRRAVGYLQRSLGLESSPRVLAQLGTAWYQAGKESEAARAWSDVLKEDENNHEARAGLAELALNRADAQAALQWLAPLATQQQTTEAAAYLLQRAHAQLGHDALAEHWRQKGADLRKSAKLRAAFEARSSRGA